MARTPTPASRLDLHRIRTAVSLLRSARHLLTQAGASQARKATHGALKSAEGALRHAHRRLAASGTDDGPDAPAA
jgi:hypothetical protein